MPSIRDLLPSTMRRRAGRWRHALLRSPVLAARALSVLSSSRPQGGPAVFYGMPRVPGLGERTHGGLVKVQRMQAAFPNSPRRFDTLYLVSSCLPEGASAVAWLARRRGRRLVWNQNGVAYQGWHGPGWEETNAALARFLRAADHVLYQSEFCRRASDLFLGPPSGSWEVLHNPVDTAAFTPGPAQPDGELVLLLGGTHNQRYRFESALLTLVRLVRRGLHVRLLVTGRFGWGGGPAEAAADAGRLVSRHQMEAHVEIVGAYAQEEAPALLRRAHVLLHTQYNDCCPGLVLEALACGVPVVYSASGGVPELVGEEAGIGVPAELRWDEPVVPDADALAEAVVRVRESWPRFSAAARSRSARFDLAAWIARHRSVFEALGR
jgi:glycosyltransferase involved in cell wall biosynthesis